VLKELEAQDKLTLLVLNKMDQVSPMLRRRFSHQFPEAIQISAKTGDGLDRLKIVLTERLTQGWPLSTFEIPYERSDVRVLLMRRGRLVKETFGQKQMILKVQVSPKVAGQFKEFRKHAGAG
jgi:GTP-binding protein HflX